MTVKQDKQRGTWVFIVDLPSVAGRRQQMKRRGYKTKREAQAAEAQALADLARGTFVRPARVTVERYLLDEWLPAKASGLKPSTAASYRQMIDSYVVPNIGARALAEVDGAMLNALYARLLASGRRGACGAAGSPLAPKTVRNVHGLLHRAFKDAVRWRRLAINPADAADQPRKNTPEMKVWTAEQLRSFVEHANADRLGALWALFALTGMRRGEVAGLRWADVDLDGKRLTVRQTMTLADAVAEVGTPKSAAGTRTISLDDATVAGLRRWKSTQSQERLVMGAGWQGGHDLLVTEPDGSPVYPQTITRRFRVLCRSAGVPVIRLHDVRHSYATAALASGVPVKVLSRRLGHADIAVTLRVYAHVMPGDDEAAAATAATFIRG